MKRALPLLAVLLVSACGAAQPTSAGPVQTMVSPAVKLSGGPPAHVAVVILENEEYSDVIGAGSAPFLDHLANTYALASRMYAVSHPSLPNYLALTGGSTFGISSDCTDCSVGGSSIADQLEAHGLSWRAYMEDLPRPCFTGAAAGDYAKKHDPFAYYTSVTANPSRCRNFVPLTQLTRDEASGSLPRFIWISPNLCHDGHDCDLSTADHFLSELLPPLLHALGPRGLLVVTWDEGTSNSGCCRLASGGHIVTMLAGGLARPGARLQTPVDHYSVLQTIEDLFDLPRLRGAACPCTPSLAPLLRTGG